jgi:hypothetical protein
MLWAGSLHKKSPVYSAPSPGKCVIIIIIIIIIIYLFELQMGFCPVAVMLQ